MSYEDLHAMILKAFQEFYEGKVEELMDADPNRWDRMVDKSEEIELTGENS